MSKAKSAVKLKPNELSVLEDAVGYVAHARDGLGDMMNNR